MMVTDFFAALYALAEETRSSRYMVHFDVTPGRIRTHLFDEKDDDCKILSTATFCAESTMDDVDKYCATVRGIVYGKPSRRTMTHAEIFCSVRAGAVVRENKTGKIYSAWCSSMDPTEWSMCREFSSGDSDKWEPLEVEE